MIGSQQEVTPTAQPLRGEVVGMLLGSWQRRELRRASRFGECGGLTREDLEDLYQDSVLVLLGREFASEDHLRRALHEALKHRALNTHRNRRRRRRIIEHAYGGDRALERAAEAEQASDRPLLAEQDQFLVREFLAELTEQEGHVFRLLADGHGWRGAADALGAPRNEIRAAARSCERKRERFALLYTTGRLCGYRAHTIEALTAGDTDSAVLARRAHAHLQACARCRIEHRTNGERFRRLFDRDALALLPLPVVVARLPLLTRLWGRAHRLGQHAGTLLSGGGASAKLAAGAASIAIAAGGTIGATQALTHQTHRISHWSTKRAPATHKPAATVRAPTAGTPPPNASTSLTSRQTPRPAKHTTPRKASRQRTTRKSASSRLASAPAPTTVSRRTLTTTTSTVAPLVPSPTMTTPTASGANGFAYLGVPHATTMPAPATIRTASVTPQGGAFSP